MSRARRPGRRFGLADLALLFQASLWAANYTIVKNALAVVQPLAFTSVRMTLAAAAFLAVAWVRRASLRFDRRDLGQLVLLGVLGHTLFQACFALGLARTTAGNTALILALAPIFVACLAAWRGEDRLSAAAWVGFVASFAGAALLVFAAGGEVRFAGEQVLGDAIVLVASLAWALYTVLSRPVLRRYSSIQLNTLILLAGVPPLVVLSLPELTTQDWAAVRPADWLAIGYAGLMAIVVAYFIYSWGVQQIGAARTAAYYNASPPLAALIAWAFAGEPLTLTYVAGAALILTGLYLVRTGTQAVDSR